MMKNEMVGTCHSSAVTNLDAFKETIENVNKNLSNPGTSHSSAVTNIDSFVEELKKVNK